MHSLPPDTVARLRDALGAAGYVHREVVELLGDQAHAALERRETTPSLGRTADGGILPTLVRLWLLQRPVPVGQAERALPQLVEPLCAAGLLKLAAQSVRARVDLRPYADEQHDWWVVSDLTPGLDGAATRVATDHVLGVSPASTSLAQLTVREPAGRALDLGTGCGVQSLHLSAHVEHVVATDVNDRALALTRLNAALNDIALDVRKGSLFEPVADEAFDLLVSNPPFVVSPGTGDLLAYRDSGLPGDDVVRHVVTQAPGHLAEGGWCHVVANWVHVEAVPWAERLESWLEGSGCDAWVVQRDVTDPASYVELWLRDAGHDRRPDYGERYDAWLRWLEAQRITAIGFGWVHLHRTGGAHHRLEEWPYDVEQPLGGEIAAWGRRVRETDLLDQRLVRRPDVRQETYGVPGAEHPETIVLRQQRAMRRARQVDTVEAALVGACDGDLTARQILAALEEILAEPTDLGDRLGDLVEEGFLVPPADAT